MNSQYRCRSKNKLNLMNRYFNKCSQEQQLEFSCASKVTKLRKIKIAKPYFYHGKWSTYRKKVNDIEIPYVAQKMIAYDHKQRSMCRITKIQKIIRVKMHKHKR